LICPLAIALTNRSLGLRAAALSLLAGFIKAKVTSCLAIFAKQASPGTEVRQWLLAIIMIEHNQHNRFPGLVPSVFLVFMATRPPHEPPSA
jgi:hypothetical protein